MFFWVFLCGSWNIGTFVEGQPNIESLITHDEIERNGETLPGRERERVCVCACMCVCVYVCDSVRVCPSGDPKP